MIYWCVCIAHQQLIVCVHVAEIPESKDSVQRLVLPGPKSNGPKSNGPMSPVQWLVTPRVYSPVDLANKILGTAYYELNSAVETSALKDLHNYMDASMKDFLQHSFSVKDMQTHMLNQKEKAANMPSLTTLVTNGVCKTAIAENAAASGLNLSHLQLIFRKAGGDGLWNVFTEMNSMGQPRVTNCKRVLESVIPKLVKYFSEK